MKRKLEVKNIEFDTEEAHLLDETSSTAAMATLSMSTRRVL
jgi:hypothetical protein